MPAIRPGWRATSAHDTAARATIRQARRVGARAWRARHSARARASHATIRRWGAYDTAPLGCDTAGGLGHDTARPAHDTARRARAWAR